MKPRRIAAYLLPLLLAAMVVTGQKPTPAVHRVSAAEATQMALKQRIEIINAQLDVKNQQAMNKEITGSAYPQISGSVGAQHYFNIPVTVLPDFLSPTLYGVLNQEGVKDGSGNTIQVPTSFGSFPAQFGVPWQASVGVAVQQLLFQPDVFMGLKARGASLELYRNQVKVQEDTVKSSVYRSYYGVLIAQKGLGFVKESEVRLAKLASDQDQLFKNGFIEKLDIEKTQVNLNNIRTTVTQLTNIVDVGYAALKFSMGIPQTDSLVLTDSLSTAEIKKDVLAITNEFNYENRGEVQVLNTTDKLLQLQVKRYKLQALPTVAANWNLGTSAQRQKFDFFDTKQRWFFSNFVGLNISVPIFDGFQRHYKVEQAKIALEKNRNTLSQFKQVVDLQVVSGRISLTNAIAALSSQEENKDLAERVYATTKKKYEGGLGSSFEVLQSETSLQQALNNYYQALYDAVIAKIGYQRAMGKL